MKVIPVEVRAGLTPPDRIWHELGELQDRALDRLLNVAQFHVSLVLLRLRVETQRRRLEEHLAIQYGWLRRFARNQFGKTGTQLTLVSGKTEDLPPLSVMAGRNAAA